MAISYSVRFVGTFALVLFGVVASGGFAVAEAPTFEWNLMLGDWQVVGPIPKLDRQAGELDRSLVADEASLQPGAAVTIDGKQYAWQEYDGRMVDFIRALRLEADNSRYSLGYAWTEFTSPEAQDGILAVGHDDGVVVWLNGEEVHRNDALVASKLDQATVPVKLKKGINTLLAKVSQGIGSWEFAARLRPAALDEPLITLPCDGSSGGDMARLPTLTLELLDTDGKEIDTWHASGGRAGTPSGARYTVFAAEPSPAPAKVRIHFDAPGFVPFDETFDWSEVRAGRVTVPTKSVTTMRGRVVDANTGEPVAGAVVRSGEARIGEPSGSDGRLELPADNPLLDFVQVVAAGYEPQQIRVAWPPSHNWTIKLSPGGHVVRGRILTSDGKPLAGAVFRYLHCDAVGCRTVELVTDADGRFEAMGLARDRNTLYPTVSHPDYIAKDSFNFPLDPDGVTEAEWRLEPGAAVTGRVTAKDDGRPLEGITIKSGADRFSSNRFNPEAKTDSDGRYRLGGIKPGPALIHAFSEEFAPAMQNTTATGKEPATVDFVLEKGQPVTGRVTDPDGKPVVGVTLAIDTWNGARMFDRRVDTDANGEFRYENMPDTPVEIHMFKRDWVSKRDLMAVGGQHYDITLLPVTEHTISVRLADTGKPPADLQVQLGYLWPGRDEISWQDEHYQQGTKYDASAGVFRIRIGEPQTAKLSWRLRVPGYRDVVIENPEPGAAPVSREVVLEKVPITTGRVVSAETGAPLEGIMVALLNKQDRLRLDHYVVYDGNFQAADRFTGVQSTTDADGSFELPKLAEDAGPVDLLLFRKGAGFHYIPDARQLLTTENVELPMPEEGSLEGRVIVAGSPMVDAEVHLAWIAPGSNADQWDLPFGFGGQVTTDAEGRFRYAGLGPGRYRVCRIRSFKNPLGGGSMSSHLTGEELVVLPGETATHEFNQPAGHTVDGTAVDTSGEPLPNCLVSVNKQSDPTGRVDAVLSDAEGKFKIEHLQPGTYMLRADQYEMTAEACGIGREGAHGTATVKVAGDTEVTIKLAPRQQSQVAQAGGQEQATLVGSLPPDFTGKLLDGESFTLSDHFGKVVAIDFWATWCGPCMAVMPEMKELHEKYKEGDDVVFVTVSLDQDAETLTNIMKEQGIEFPVIFESREASQAIASAFGVRGIPSSFVIGRNGRFAADSMHGSKLLAATEAAVKEPLDPAFAKAGKPARLVVKLALDDGSGVPGATIELKAVDAAGKTVLEETIRTPGQATQFTWLYPPLEEGGELHVKAMAEGLASQERTLSSPAAASEAALRFECMRRITGRIAADDGAAPVSGAKVTAYRQDGFRRTATTDAEGIFRIGVLSGSYAISFAGTDQFAPVGGEREQIEVADDSDPSEVELSACRTVTVTGTVTDEDGAPVAGAQVRTAASETSVTTDEEGRFELGGVPSRGSVQLYAIKRPKYAIAALEDVDGSEPQALVLGQQAGGPQSFGAGAKAPKLTVYTLENGKPIEWRPSEEKETLVLFCALWNPLARELLSSAKVWADEHQAHFVPVSIDWSLDQARRAADAVRQQPGGDYNILYAGPGGLAIAKEWNLHPTAQAYLVSADGKIRRAPPPGQLP